jgi:dihydroorotase
MTEPKHDLILAGGRVVDPASGTNMVSDVAVCDGVISEIGRDLPVASGREIVDVSGQLVVPGLIDTHAHVYEHVSGRFGLNPDLVGVHSGVTTVVDQGGASCMTFPGFDKFIADPSDTRVLSFISAYVVGGLEGHYYPDLYSPAGVDVDATVRVALAHPNLIRGVKAHAEIGGFERWGTDVLRLGVEIARAIDRPLYIHFGQLWPRPDRATVAYDVDEILRDVVPLLAPGDILAHPFTRHPGGFVDKAGNVHPIVSEALDRGLRIDVGHGSHFSIDIARRALDAGIAPHTLGADMHGYNTQVPAPAGTPNEHPDDEMHAFAGQQQFSLAFAMSEMLALGIELPDVVAMVTSNAAGMISEEDTLGRIEAGRAADITILDDLTGNFVFRDNGGVELESERMLQPAFCLRDGTRFDADANILPRLPG